MALVVGTPGNDVLVGTAEADEIRGLGGNDRLEGGEGNDQLFGGAGNDELLGGAGDDWLDGEDGTDILDGGSGNDTLVLRAINGSSFQGGDGWDVLRLGAGIGTLYATIDLSTGFITSGAPGSVTSTVGGIEEVHGFRTVIGSDADERLVGGQVMQGGGGNDVLETTADSYIGLEAPPAPVTVLEGGSGDDTIIFSKRQLYGRFVYDVGARLDGGEGQDTLVFKNFTSQIDEVSHGRTIYYGIIADLTAGTAQINRNYHFGIDSISGFENLTGTDQNDILLGDAADNILRSGAGDDSLRGGAGNDLLDGGVGFDWLLLEGATAPTLVDLALGTAQDGQGGTDTLISIEAVQGSAQADTLLGTEAADMFFGGGGDDHLVGRGGNDDLRGDDGNDWLEGGEGNDTLRGGAGDDRIDGGAGFDIVIMDGLTFHGSGRALSVEGLLQLTTAEGTDTLSGVEEVRFLDGRLVLDADAPEAMVARLYAMALERTPEAHGLSFWSAQLEAGASLSSVADGILGSDEFTSRHGSPADNAGFVAMLYHDLLGRAPDAAGAIFWDELLAGGMSRGAVLAGFSESLENRALTTEVTAQGFWRLDTGAAEVARLYDTLLGRGPDAAGLVTFTALLQAGSNGVEVARGMLTSVEYQQNVGNVADDAFVASLYRTALDRTPDEAGLAFWTDMLAQGLSRAEVALAISESDEHLALTSPWIENGILIA
ncbi:DUF4214 domain-containing protein [Roseomonas marmotae]|uniref:DUF4214 domain-containing protein n=1 Tax=Roseomonas marmotae TaxID=2768161 RepID=UPI00234FF817|nr:DUF4214 domain-containing protein [Roseomonas marmotae]